MQVRDRPAIHRRPVSIDVLAMSIAMVLCQHAQAQETAPPSIRVEGTLEEIIVTAQKREERVIDVPIAISAFDDSAIKARGATSLEELQFSVPGLSIMSYGTGASTFIQLRGISNTVGRPTVGRYVNEVPVNIETNGAGPQVRIMDIERMEVLRGPQPTFYGDGSMGGTVRYVTAKPSMKELSGGFRADVSSMTDGGTGWMAEGNLDIPVAEDRAGFRLAGAYEDRSGWIDRVPTGEEDVNGLEQYALRGSFGAKLGESSELQVMWEHSSQEVDNQHFGTDRKTQLTVPTPVDSESDIVSASLSVDLGFATLVEAPGYVKWQQDSTFDVSPFYVLLFTLPPPFGLGLPPGYITEVALAAGSESETFFNELRLVSNASDGLTWAVGLDYKDISYGGTGTTLTGPNELPVAFLETIGATDDEVWTGWAEAGYDLSDRWNIGAGIRYFHNETQSTANSILFGFPNLVDSEATFTSTNPRLSVRYKVNENWNVYASAAKGFRSGGFNLTDPTHPTYDPESLWSYELGSKGLYFDRRLDVEAAVWYNDWKDVQSSTYLPGGFTVVSNGGNVQGVGVDLGVTVRPTEDFSFGATYGWNNLEYKEVPRDCSSGTCVPASDKLVGDPPDLAVQLSWSAFLDYRRALGTGSAFYGRADFQHSDDAQVTVRSPLFDTITEFPARDLLNLRLGMTFGNYDVSLYANNALDEDKPVVEGPFGVIAEDISASPRVIGLAAQVRF